jgi:hypothetical protein
MNRIRRSRLVKFGSIALALLTTLLLVSASASAKEHKAKKSDNEAHVVAHIPFSGLSEVDMTMQKRASDQYYVYVQHSKGEGISVVDVSEPAKTKIVAAIRWSDPAASSRMNVTGNLAIIVQSQIIPINGSTAKDDLVLWDLSNPATPRLVQKFSEVVQWFQDERNFIYVLNGDGLWVVSQPSDRQREQIHFSTLGG